MPGRVNVASAEASRLTMAKLGNGYRGNATPHHEAADFGALAGFSFVLEVLAFNGRGTKGAAHLIEGDADGVHG